MNTDLAHIHLEMLLADDKPRKQVAETLRSWVGPLPEELVRALGNYFDPKRPRLTRRPYKNFSFVGKNTSPIADHLVMTVFFQALRKGAPDPVATTGLKKRTFEAVRTRYVKRLCRDFKALFSQPGYDDKSAAEYLRKREGIPTEYWEKSINLTL